MAEKSDIPNIPWKDFPHPSVVLDTLVRERTGAFTGTTGITWKPIEPGTPYPQAVQHTVADAALNSSAVFLGQKLGQDRSFYDLFFATPPQTQDVYNYAVSYSGKSNTFPIFKRQYLELRDTYQARADLSPLTGLFAVTITNAGGGYDPANPPAVTCNNGATAIAIVNSFDGSIAKITLKNEGANCTTSVTIAAPPSGGTQATAVGVLQPSNCLLTDEEAVPAPAPYDSLYLLVTRIYTTLPGPRLISIVPDPELGIPVLTMKEDHASTDTWQSGLLFPAMVSGWLVTNATIATNTTLTVSNLGTNTTDYLIPGEYVRVNVSGTTPAINGNYEVLSTAPTTITIAFTVTAISGPNGEASAYAGHSIARVATENVNVVEKVVTLAATGDVKTFNQTTLAFRPYPFPGSLLAIYFYTDQDTASSAGMTFARSRSYSGSIGFDILAGFRGDCESTRIRFFFMGPVTSMPNNPNTSLPYSPTVVMPAAGTVTVEGGAKSESVNLAGESTMTKSVSFKGTPVAETLQAATFSGTITPVGSGSATATLNLIPSVVKDTGSPARKYFLQGDIITAIDPPELLRGIGVYMMTIWQIVCPYTTGLEPDQFTYEVNPATYPNGTLITQNSPIISASASGFVDVTGLPSGLSVNPTSGNIDGTPFTPTAQAFYTITCTLNGITQTAVVSITIT